MRPFRLENPVQLVFGAGSVKRVGRLLHVDHAARVLLVTGQGSAEKSGALDAVLASLAKHGVTVAERARIRPGPCVEDLRDLARLADDVDAVLAVGGGSVMDAAKVLAAAPFVPDVWEPAACGRHIREALPIYVVATLSGTGSEVNDHALITSREHAAKAALKGPALFPRAAVVDPALQTGAPFALTARSAMDAMAHVLEHYVMGEPGTGQECSLAVCEALMRVILDSLRILRQSPDAPQSGALEARADLAWAAILAQNGTAGAGLGGGEWTVHVLAHALEAHALAANAGAATQTPAQPPSHAELVAALFPAWVKTMHDRAPGLFARWAQEVWRAPDPDQAVALWREALEEWGLAPDVRRLGLDGSVLDAARQSLAHAPPGRRFPLSITDLDQLLEQA